MTTVPFSSPSLQEWRPTGLPLFSIIITCFNKVAYIEEAIQSALGQFHECFEVIVVDDGSQDGSWDIIRSFAKRHPNVLAARHASGRNLGEGASRGLGLDLSRGLFILYLDGDDRLLPARLQHDEAVIERFAECTSVVSRTRYFHQNIESGTRTLFEDAEMVDCIAPLSDHLYGELEFFLACFYDLEQGQAVFKGIPCVGAVTTRRDVAAAVPWQREFSCAADICYFAEVLMRKGIYYSGECHAEYRLTTEGAWYQARQNESEDFWQRLTKRRIQFLALDVESAALEAAQKSLSLKVKSLQSDGANSIAQTGVAGEAIPAAPFCSKWGLSRGLPVDRYYVDRFLARHSADIRGRVLEIGDDGYTRRFGTADLESVDVLDVDPNNQRATIIADLCHTERLVPDSYDCVVMTQVLPYTESPVAALRNVLLALKPGGVLLCTCPAITPVSPEINERDRWYWSVYSPTARLLFDEAGFQPQDLLIESWGNLRVATAFLWGLAQEDLTEADFQPCDVGYPLITTIRAVRPI